MTLVGKACPRGCRGKQLLCYAYLQTHAAVALDGLDGSRLSKRGRGSQRTRDTEGGKKEGATQGKGGAA